MRIAMIGQKGVPATHGGVERHVEELGARLAAAGHEVVVFTRPNYTDSKLVEHRGMRLESVPTIGTKHLDALVHSLLATLRTWRGSFDIVHYHAVGPCLVSPLARLRGRRVVATIHGQDWRRGKWNAGASAVLRLAEWMALRVPDRTLCVSRSLTEAYREAGHDVTYIPNGIAIDDGDEPAFLDTLGVEDRGYVLFAGRLVPEKGLHHLLDAWRTAPQGVRLVVAGDDSHSGDYAESLRAGAGDGVVFAGYVYGAKLATLFRHAALFVLASDLEGLPIVLLEALAYGTPVLASDIAPNREILGEDGSFFRAGDAADLGEQVIGVLGEKGGFSPAREATRERMLREYDWERIARRVEAVYEAVQSGRRRCAEGEGR